MILMVSVQNLDEALEALKGGADIVDVKNLQEALVGSAHPKIVGEVRKAVPEEIHASVTLGVVPNQVGTVAMAAYAAGALNATSVKVGFMKTSYEVAVDTLLACRAALEGTETKLIGSLFADNPLYDGLDPNFMMKLAQDGKCDGILIDTLTKDGRNLFDFMPEEILRDMVFEGKEHLMSTALSGHLRLENLDELARINPDIVGVRGAVCKKGNRGGSVHWEAVTEFKNQINLRKTGEVTVNENANEYMNGQGPSSDEKGWIVIDGTGKSCAGIIASLSEEVKKSTDSVIEVIIPDVLNTYDVLIWAEKGNHKILTQRKDSSGSTRILINTR
tara:strand:+ start:1632 stop:2627 length:996 start_codon:yes stop_codon:yes gene_type:complete